ncbi:NYN domain-containing protein [Kutzneria sp. NPDC052558]|uniref:NYN domain-containing protein n=1 Tax=Kutzneria sp. NPDC052558 TaxID=3364121 RepID=UPI0037C5B779
MTTTDVGVLLVDWENLTGAILNRGALVERHHVHDLWLYANAFCGDQLHHKHMAAARFDPTIATAMHEHFIDAAQVESRKEQADILLTVLAMDYLHAGVTHFVLVTGDQDFIPLIERLHRAGRKVAVIYGDSRKLSDEMTKVLNTPDLESLDIATVTVINPREPDTSSRSLLGLLELQRRGHILGGPERGDRVALLAQWHIVPNTDQNEYWSLANAMTERVTRTNAAMRGQDGQWTGQNRERTYLKISREQLADIVAIDYAIRQISGRVNGVAIGSLTGPFQADDGRLADRALDALQTVGHIRQDAQGAFTVAEVPLQLGYLEQLWRVYACLTAECYWRKKASIPYNQLSSLLNRRGIGQGPEQRSAGRIREAVNYAKATGVVDTVMADRSRHVIAPTSMLSRPFELAYHELYRLFHDRLGTPVPEMEFLEAMAKADNAKTVPLFGYDNRDRHRIVRVMAQSRLVAVNNNTVTVQRHPWGDAGVRLRR